MSPQCSFLNLRVLLWNSIVLIWQLWKWQLVTFRGSAPSPDHVACALEISSVPFKTRHMLTKWGRAIGDFIKRRWGNLVLSNISFCLSHYGHKMIRNKTGLSFWLCFSENTWRKHSNWRRVGITRFWNSLPCLHIPRLWEVRMRV